MPRRVTGFAAIGKYHRIEVEDEVTAFFEHENGMVGHFITSTAESPGANRLEIIGESGRLVFENEKLTFSRNRSSMLEFIQTSPAPYDKVACDVEEVPFSPQLETGHAALTQAFVQAVLQRRQPVVDAAEGIYSLTLANAILLSHFWQRPLELPLDADAYERKLAELKA
jgi:predicted dehydrogenase